MRKFLIVAIPIVTLAIFICIMLSGSILKKTLTKDDDVAQCINHMMQRVDKEDWEEASKGVEDLDKAWKKVMKRIQFSAERDEINYISTNIARLRGAIEAKDKSNALMELNAAYNHWKDIGK